MTEDDPEHGEIDEQTKKYRPKELPSYIENGVTVRVFEKGYADGYNEWQVRRSS